MEKYVIERVIFFFNDTATTEIYTLSLHDALPIWSVTSSADVSGNRLAVWPSSPTPSRIRSKAGMPFVPKNSRSSSSDRKSTRLNSSHANISYAVFCLKKKNQ